MNQIISDVKLFEGVKSADELIELGFDFCEDEKIISDFYDNESYGNCPSISTLAAYKGEIHVLGNRGNEYFTYDEPLKAFYERDTLHALKKHLEDKTSELQAMEQVTYNHQHEYSDDTKELRNIQFSALTHEIILIEERIKELTPVDPSEIIPELADIYESFKTLSATGDSVNAYKALLLRLSDKFGKHVFAVRSKNGHSTSYEFDKSESLYYLPANKLPRMGDGYGAVNNVHVIFDKDSIVATFEFEPHNSIHSYRKYIFTYQP